MSNGNDNSRTNAASGRPLGAIILAAGKGTRMQSDLPKVAHCVAGRPIVYWVVQAVRRAGAERVILVIGHGADVVREVFRGDDDDIEYVIQAEQKGTGHATLVCAPAIEGFRGDMLVLAGDGPLIRAETINAMHELHVKTGAAATLATSVIDDPTGYGRIVRDADNRFEAIVEHRNATESQRAIHEVYPSYAVFDVDRLFEMLRRLPPDPDSGEYYVTDVPNVMRREGATVEVIDAVPPEDILSINTPQQLAEVDAILTARLETATR